MVKNSLASLLSDMMLGFGALLAISPIPLYWFIHGSYERYIWIISGPYPFSSFGGGPFQLFMFTGLFLLGILLIYISRIIKGRIK